jgi:hypothetical protein
LDQSPSSDALCHRGDPSAFVVQFLASVFRVAASALYRLDGREQIGAATGCVLCSGLLPRERNLHLPHLGAHSPKPGYRGSIDGAPDHALPIGHDFVPFWRGCVGGAEISAGWTRNLYLLPHPLSQARSAGSADAEVSAINAETARLEKASTPSNTASQRNI